MGYDNLTVGEGMGPLYHARIAMLGCFHYITLC